MIVMQRHRAANLLPATCAVVAASLVASGQAAEPRPAKPMQVPAWVKSIGEATVPVSEKATSPAASQLTEAVIPVGRPNVGGQITGRPRSGSRKTTPPAADRRPDAAAAEQLKADRPESGPSFTERAARLFDPKVYAAAWNDLLPKPNPKPSAVPAEPTADDPPRQSAVLGPETSVLNRAETPAGPTWQRPLAAARSLLKQPSPAAEATAIETSVDRDEEKLPQPQQAAAPPES